jgi:1-deoxy-D-xylulose-5-phosphate reductoisomerase
MMHSLVEYVDGSVLAQLGNPDMRTPIAHALGWPERHASRCRIARPHQGRRGSISRRRTLGGFPACRLARAAAEAGGTAPAVLNAANEVAVAGLPRAAASGLRGFRP